MSVELYDDGKQAVPEPTDRLTYRDMSVTPQPDAAYNATVREVVNAGLEVVTGGAGGTDKELVLRNAAAAEVGRLAVLPVPVVGTAALATDYDDGLEHLELTATPVVDRWHVYRRVGAGAWTLFRRVENVAALATSEMVLSNSGLTPGTAYDLAARGERLGVVGPLSNIVEYTWGGALPAAVMSGSPGVVVGASMLVTVTLSTAGITAPSLATFTGHKMYVRPCGYPWRGEDGWEEMGSADDGNPRVLDLDLGTWELAARWVRNEEQGPLSYLATVIGGGAAPNEGAVASAAAEQTAAGVRLHFTTGSAFTNAHVFFRKVGAVAWTVASAPSADLCVPLGVLEAGNYEAKVIAETAERYSSEAVAVTWTVQDPVILELLGGGLALEAAAGAGAVFYGARDLLKFSAINTSGVMAGRLAKYNMGIGAAPVTQLITNTGVPGTIDICAGWTQLGSDTSFWGPAYLDAANTGVMASFFQNSGTSSFRLVTMTAGVYATSPGSSNKTLLISSPGQGTVDTVWIRLTKTGTVYRAWYSLDGQAWEGPVEATISGTPTKWGIGQCQRFAGSSANSQTSLLLRWAATRA